MALTDVPWRSRRVCASPPTEGPVKQRAGFLGHQLRPLHCRTLQPSPVWADRECSEHPPRAGDLARGPCRSCRSSPPGELALFAIWPSCMLIMLRRLATVDIVNSVGQQGFANGPRHVDHAGRVGAPGRCGAGPAGYVIGRMETGFPLESGPTRGTYAGLLEARTAIA